MQPHKEPREGGKAANRGQQRGQNGEKRPGIGGLSLRQPCFSLREKASHGKKSPFRPPPRQSSQLARKAGQRTTRGATHRHVEVLGVRHGGAFGENRQSPARRRAAESSEAARDRVAREAACACAAVAGEPSAADFRLFLVAFSQGLRDSRFRDPVRITIKL